MGRYFIGGEKMKNKLIDSLVIGDLQNIASRQKAIKIAEDSILKAIKGKKFKTIIFLGDLFDKKPTAKERCLLADFINKLRKYTKRFDFIIGNGKHTFEGESIHEQDWIKLCSDFYQHEELEIGNFVFTHSEFKGLTYINGHKSDSKRKADPNKIYVSGHIHSGEECSFDNVNYVGSMYKTSFAEIADNKRVGVIEDNKLSWIPIKSFPMYEIKLIGDSGKVKVSGLKQLKDSGDEYIDLKIKVETDSTTLGEIHRTIGKIKNKYKIEYYKDDIKIKEIKTDIPEDLDQEALLKNYCKQKKIPYKLIVKELK